MKPTPIEVPITVDAEAFDRWVADLRVLVSHIGFALDSYLVDRRVEVTPPAEPEGER